MFIFGYEKFKENGDPIDNCIDYSFEGWRICDNSNILLNMFQHMDWKYLLKDDGGEFKKGIFVAAEKTGAPINVMVFYYTNQSLDWSREDSLVEGMKKYLKRHREGLD